VAKKTRPSKPDTPEQDPPADTSEASNAPGGGAKGADTVQPPADWEDTPSPEAADPKAGTEGAEEPDQPADAGSKTSDAPESDDDASEKAASETETSDSAPDGPAPETDDEQPHSPEEDSTPPATSPPPVAPEQLVIRKGGFTPMVFGGIVAAVIGFGAGYYLNMQDDGGLAGLQDETQTRLDAQADRIADLSDRLGAARQAPDLAAIEAQLSEIRETVEALSGRLDDTGSRIAELAERVDTLETRPLAEGGSDAAVAAFDAQLEKLQEAMARQRAEIEDMTARAQDMEAQAEQTAQATMQRAALSRIQTALDAGGGFAPALADLRETGIEVPDILSDTANSGVATLSQLQESFPPLARDALAAARAAAADAGETGGFGAFLRNQLGVRSLEPREGDDPDAILSRAEAATAEGRLNDALAEIEALPDAARAELADWRDRARLRLRAQAAAQSLSEELN